MTAQSVVLAKRVKTTVVVLVQARRMSVYVHPERVVL